MVWRELTRDRVGRMQALGRRRMCRGKGMGSHGFGWEQGRGKHMGRERKGIAMVVSPWMRIEPRKKKRLSGLGKSNGVGDDEGWEGREQVRSIDRSDTNCQDPGWIRRDMINKNRDLRGIRAKNK